MLFTPRKHEESKRKESETDKGIYYLCRKFGDSSKEIETKALVSISTNHFKFLILHEPGNATQ